MGVFICPVCERASESHDGDCIPALTPEGGETFLMVHEACATPAELYAYLPGVYEKPEATDET